MVEEYSSKVDVPMGIFEIPAEEKKARGILKTSYGKIFLQFGREINSTRNMKKQKKQKKKQKKTTTKKKKKKKKNNNKKQKQTYNQNFRYFITCLLAQMNTEAQFKILFSHEIFFLKAVWEGKFHFDSWNYTFMIN